MATRASTEGRWTACKCARCAVTFTAMTRGVPRKYCDDCQNELRLARRRDAGKKRGPRKRACGGGRKLIRYAGWGGGASQ